MFTFLSAPIDTPTLSILPLACSLRGNYIGVKGASALAAILKETQIQQLECAAAPERSLLCQRPLTLLLSHHPRAPLTRQLGQQPALWPLLGVRKGRGHLHRGGHHKAVRGAQGERRDLAKVRRRH